MKISVPRIAALLFFAAASQAFASVTFYQVNVTITSGTQTGQTGTGVFSIDDTLVQTSGTDHWVAPDTGGLLTFSLDILGTTLDLSNVLGYPVLPTVTLDGSNVPIGFYGVWGSSTATVAQAFTFSGTSFTFDSAANFNLAVRNSDGTGSFENVPDGANDQSLGSFTIDLATPEPATMLLVPTSILVLLWMRRRRTASVPCPTQR